MKDSTVFVLGGYQTDFATNWTRQKKGIADLLHVVVQHALEKTQIHPNAIDNLHLGNFAGELFCHQGLLGGVLAEVHPTLQNVPVMRHEADCASGSMAILAAMSNIQAGYYDLACVVGVELMRNIAGDQAASHLGSAAWHGREAQTKKYVWPFLFSELMNEYNRRYGLDYKHIGRIAEINFCNAQCNPNAQTRKWKFAKGSFTQNDELNPIVEGRIRKNDCGQITDGAAVVFLASEKGAQEYANRQKMDLAKIPYIKGWGHGASRIDFAKKVEQSQREKYIFPHVRNTTQQALHKAKMSSVFELDGIEIHDCFAITEYMAIDHWGITKAGESWKAVEEGWLEKHAKIPINPSGGLIGLGHPVGATGVRMLLDCYKQVTGKAEEYQVEEAKDFATLNIGGSTTAVVSFIVGTL